MSGATKRFVEEGAAAKEMKYRITATVGVSWRAGRGRSGWLTRSLSTSSKSLAMKVHMQVNSNGIALRRLRPKSFVLTKKGRKIARQPSNEESRRVSRNIARRVCTIIPSYPNVVNLRGIFA